MSRERLIDAIVASALNGGPLHAPALPELTAHFEFDDDGLESPAAANDNSLPWPHVPFPDGWWAS